MDHQWAGPPVRSCSGFLPVEGEVFLPLLLVGGQALDFFEAPRDLFLLQILEYMHRKKQICCIPRKTPGLDEAEKKTSVVLKRKQQKSSLTRGRAVSDRAL